MFLDIWLPDWEAAYLALPEKSAPARLHPYRHAYYKLAFEGMIDGGEPMAILYPLLHTWTLALNSLGVDHPAIQPWSEALTALSLLGEAFEARIEALDAYLDMVEETLDAWAKANGIG